MNEQVERAKTMLKNYRDNNLRITAKYEQINALMDAATRATSSTEAVRVSGTGERSRIESAMIRKIDLQRQLDESLDRLNAQRFRIQNAIDEMEDAREARMLELYYLYGKSRRTWPSVNKEMEIGPDNSKKIYKKAIEHFAAIYYSKGRGG